MDGYGFALFINAAKHYKERVEKGENLIIDSGGKGSDYKKTFC